MLNVRKEVDRITELFKSLHTMGTRGRWRFHRRGSSDAWLLADEEQAGGQVNKPVARFGANNPDHQSDADGQMIVLMHECRELLLALLEEHTAYEDWVKLGCKRGQRKERVVFAAVVVNKHLKELKERHLNDPLHRRESPQA